MKAVREIFDLTPRGITAALDLRKPIYSATAAYGHFGRTPEKLGNGRVGRHDVHVGADRQGGCPQARRSRLIEPRPASNHDSRPG